MSKPIVAVTHSGSFHTDDVFAAATLELFYAGKDLKIIRSRDESDIKNADIVFDVGAIYDPRTLRFDHHQKGGAGERENGIPYSSFGLVWKEYGAVLCGGADAAKIVDERLVQCVDGPDSGVGDISMANGYYPYGLQDIIGAERPTWQENIDIRQAFDIAVGLAKEILTRAIVQTKSFLMAKEKIQERYDSAQDKKIIDIGIDYPGWYTFMVEHPEVLYVVYESEGGAGFTVRATRKDPLKFDTRKPFPKSWGGLRDEQLQELTGVPDAIFCHNNLFLVKAKSKEGALELARIAVEY